MTTADTRAKVIEKLQADMANRMAIEANQQEQLEKLSEQMECNQGQFNHNNTIL